MHAFLGLAGLAFQARASTWAPELELEQLSPRQKPSEDRFADVHREPDASERFVAFCNLS